MSPSCDISDEQPTVCPLACDFAHSSLATPPRLLCSSSAPAARVRCGRAQPEGGEHSVGIAVASHPKNRARPRFVCRASTRRSWLARSRPTGGQRAARGPAETIWRCGSARGSAGRGAQRGRPTARRTWGKTVRDKRRLSQVPAAQASAADECRCGGLGGDPPIIPRASRPPPADVHWGGGLGGTVG